MLDSNLRYFVTKEACSPLTLILLEKHFFLVMPVGKMNKTSVDNLGFEPRTHGCKPSVFPLSLIALAPLCYRYTMFRTMLELNQVSANQ